MCAVWPRLPQPSWATRMRSLAPMERERSAAVSGFFQATAAATPEVLRNVRRLSEEVGFSEAEFMVMEVGRWKGTSGDEDLVEFLGKMREVVGGRQVAREALLGDEVARVVDFVEGFHHGR